VAIIKGEDSLVIDVARGTAILIAFMEGKPTMDSWSYRKCRWNPWSRDGHRLAFVREGQICMSNFDGNELRQLTFDRSRKCAPTFSPDGKRIAYVAWQPDNRRHYTRYGPTDLWVVDVETTLSARVTAPASGGIHCLDWLDDNTLIFDRFEAGLDVSDPAERYHSTLRRLELKRPGIWPNPADDAVK